MTYYTYSGDKLTAFGSESITYDEYGRTSRYRGKNIFYGGYDAHNISYFGNASFTYYEDDLRPTKTVGGVTHYYTYEGIYLVKEEWGNNVVIYLYDADGTPVGMQHRTTSDVAGDWDTYYYEKNLQGDVIAIYNASGTKLVSYTYDAWGNFTRTDVASSVPNVVKNNPITYRGYYYDHDLDLYYLTTRYYDPETCRFVTADDPAYLGANGDLISYNLYAYCSNNPVMYVDPTGHAVVSISLIVGLVVSFIIGTTASAISQYVQYDGEVNWIQASTDGLFAAASTALAYTGIGLIGSIAAGGGLGLAQYTFDSAVFHNDFTWSGALIATGLGALGGLASGRGAQHFKSIGSNLDETGRIGVKAILTAYDRYGKGAGYQKVMNLWGGRVANSLELSISQNFTKSTLIIWGTTAASYKASYWLNKINWGF